VWRREWKECRTKAAQYDSTVPEPLDPRGGNATKRRFAKFVARRFANPLMRGLLERGLAPKTHALLETIGRKSGLPRRVPVGNGLRGREFWIVTEHGYAADYVKNIQQQPRVRVKVGRRWLEGNAHILPEDDVAARLRFLRRPANDALVRLAGTQLLTIRIDLDEA
jgi:deazaflavin-dependent oxidoreductase (nitroreductase family)